jgi:hypothetical protein
VLGQTEPLKRSVCSPNGCDHTIGQIDDEIEVYRDYLIFAPRGRHIFITGRKKNSAEAAPAFLVVDVSFRHQADMSIALTDVRCRR